jgi:molybdenum cofactor biosynthesis enzyme MoaA
MRLEEIGFYTLSDHRAEHVSWSSPMVRGEIILTGRCNFRCAYCRGLKVPEDIAMSTAITALVEWGNDRLRNVRFSGGEPTLYPKLPALVEVARNLGVERIAVSSNGSRPWSVYDRLLSAGVNDFSISLDACCAADAAKMAGGVDRWERLTANLRELASRAYTTVGVVLTADNVDQVVGIAELAHDLGVADVRVIPAAQDGAMLTRLSGVSQALAAAHPILAYRLARAASGEPVRGLHEPVSCHLVKDDSAVMGEHHYPCIIYLREGGSPIGPVGQGMREQRRAWFEQHEPFEDPICRGNCLDVCVAHNQRCAELSN